MFSQNESDILCLLLSSVHIGNEHRRNQAEKRKKKTTKLTSKRATLGHI